MKIYKSLSAIAALIFTATTFAVPMQIATLRADDASANNGLGEWVAIDGNTIVAKSNTGLYVFEAAQSPPETWIQTFKIVKPADIQHYQGGLRLSGDTIAIKAFTTASCEVVQVYNRDGMGPSWTLSAHVMDPEGGCNFPVNINGIGLSGEWLAVSRGHSEPPLTDVGILFMFRRDHGGSNNWGYVKAVQPNEIEQHDRFGASIAISGNTMLVGATENKCPPAALGQGKAYVFEKDHGGTDNWGQVRKIERPSGVAVPAFGGQCALYGSTAVIGHSECNGYNEYIHIFEQNVGGADNWGLVASKSFTFTNSMFGNTVKIAGNFMAADHGIWDHTLVYGRDHGGVGNWGTVADLVDVSFFDISGEYLVAYVPDNEGGNNAGSVGVWRLNEAPSCEPPDCSGHGTCDDGMCVCDGGWTGNDCGTEAEPIPAVSTWGVGVLLLLLATAGAVVLRRGSAVGA